MSQEKGGPMPQTAQKRIGEFLVEKGVLTPLQVEEILAYGKRTGLRFGDAGLSLKILTERQLVEVFGRNFRIPFFHLNPAYFPQATRELVSVESMLSAGAIPLGFKRERGFFTSRKVLNLGMIDPSRAEARELAENEARARSGVYGFDGVKVFLVLADQFMSVLETHYRVPPEVIRKVAQDGELDPTLAMFVGAAEGGSG